MVHDVERLATQLEVDAFMNLEVPEETDVETVVARPINDAALLVADLHRGGCWSHERRTIEPVQASVDLLAVTVVRIQHLVWTQRRRIGTVHDAQTCRV